jgi:hypothetical protein
VAEGGWAAATARITTMIKKGIDPLEGMLGEGYGTGRVVERHARLFAESNKVDVAMIMPVLLAAFSGATQGAFLAPVYSEDWTPAHVPLVFQFLGIAESGARKSTVIREGRLPLEMALNKGVVARRQQVAMLRQQAMEAAGHAGDKVDQFAAVYQKVYDGGICASTLTDGGTQEGIRNKLIGNGGHRVLITGESDVLQEVSKYQKGAGSLGLFVRTWDQETLSIDRANENAHLYMPEASLPFLIFVQPNAFAEHTAPGPKGYDEFTDKGVFGRAWLWRMPKPAIPEGFAFKPKPKAGESSALLAARLVSLERMALLVERSNDYRMAKGIRYAWETSPGAAQTLKEPAEVKREVLDLDEGSGGVEAFVRVQNMLLDLRRALEEADEEDKGLAYQYHPLVARFTDHVMRLSALLTLADDPGALAVDTAHVEDVATRLMPWLWSGWVAVMGERRRSNVEEFIEEQTLKNPKGMDLSKRAAVLRVMGQMTKEDGPSGTMVGFPKNRISERARYRVRGWKKVPGLMGELGATLEGLANEGQFVQRISGHGPADALGKAAYTFRLTAAGIAEADKLDGF